MRLLCLADLHGAVEALDGILQDAGPADVVLAGGDITHFGTPNSAEALIRRMQRACPTVLAVAGNCDSAAIDGRLVELGVSLFGRAARREALGFCGVSSMPPWCGTMYELTEEEIAAALRRGHALLSAVSPTVLLTHAPPRDTALDVTRHGAHVGSTAVREFIVQAAPALVVCGHIHESRGIDRLGPTLMVNCGTACHGHYAVAEIDDQVQVELRRAATP